jgi:hypothetical protein
LTRWRKNGGSWRKDRRGKGFFTIAALLENVQEFENMLEINFLNILPLWVVYLARLFCIKSSIKSFIFCVSNALIFQNNLKVQEL